MILVLWDIDLTLVDYSGLGRRWYGEALGNLFGVTMRHLPEFPGRTERALTTELLTAHGIASDEDAVRKVYAELIRIAAEARPRLSTLGRALPGAAEVLGELSANTGVVQSLVTGNLIELAGYKLAPFGLDKHVDFEIGGYGGGSLDRHDLVHDAITQASAKHATEFAPTSVVVIGDSPLDVAAGRHHGVTTVGVATGRSSVEELRAAGADTVLPSLADTDAVLEALLGAAA